MTSSLPIKRLAVLVSIGRHPASGRARRNDLDARAVELAQRLPASEIHLLHAGNPDDACLRAFLGTGVAQLDVLPVQEGSNVAPALADALRSLRPDLVLCGARGERGFASGFLPYAIAAALDLPLVGHVCAIERNDQAFRVTCAEGAGRRRIYEVREGVLTIGERAPAPRQIAFAGARSGRIHVVSVVAPALPFEKWTERAARRRAPRLRRAGVHATADARLQAAMETRTGAGNVLQGLSSAEAAERLLEWLATVGAAPRGRKPS